MRPARWLMLLSSLFLVSLNAMLGQFAEDTYDFTLTDCQDLAYICSEYDDTDFNNFDFYVDGLLLTDARDLCNSGQGSRFGFDVGTHTIEARDGAMVLDQATINVACDPLINYTYQAVFIPNSITVCPDLSALSGPVDAVTVTPSPTVVTVALGTNDCFDITPTAIGIDSLVIRYCDDMGNCDEAPYIFDSNLATPIINSTVYDTVPVPGDVFTFCIDTMELPGNIVSVTDICADGSEEFVQFTLTEQTVCLKYRGLAIAGTDTSCVVVCDDLGFCDTTVVIVTTVGPNVFPDQNLMFTIEKGNASSTTLDLSAFTNPPNSVINSCPGLSGTFVEYAVAISNFSVQFDGVEVGMERACIDLENSDGRRQRVNITVNVIQASAAADTVRIRNGDSFYWCFGPYELPGNPIDMTDNCPATNQLVSLEPVADITCFDIQAFELGVQNLCMTLCDADGFCDIVNLVVQVVPNDDDRLPIANDDYYPVAAGSSNNVPPLLNDSSIDPITYAAIVSGPTIGVASFNADFTLNYALSGSSCAAETIIYEICNNYGCDQATITFDCEGSKPAIINRSGFSPNFDGVNDTWTITNIEFYPESVIKVYNRWGSRVLEVKGYSNNWDGTFDSAPLPDGTYFFVAEFNEPGLEPVAGYVQLRR
ncbi:MAG: gliding motility-associated C-terminal domain-containing protein [Saprospiraceae bacterium]